MQFETTTAHMATNNQESHEKFLIAYYFSGGFSYKEILLFLEAQQSCY